LIRFAWLLPDRDAARASELVNRRPGVLVTGEPPGIAEQKHRHHDPPAEDQIANRLRKGSNGGRPPTFDPTAYKRRNTVEHGYNRRKHWRGSATRYDKSGAHFQTTLDLVEMLDWLRAVPDSLDLRDRN